MLSSRKSQADQRNGFEKLLDAAWRLRERQLSPIPGKCQRSSHTGSGRVRFAQSGCKDHESAQVAGAVSKTDGTRKGMRCESVAIRLNGA